MVKVRTPLFLSKGRGPPCEGCRQASRLIPAPAIAGSASAHASLCRLRIASCRASEKPLPVAIGRLRRPGARDLENAEHNIGRLIRLEREIARQLSINAASQQFSFWWTGVRPKGHTGLEKDWAAILGRLGLIQGRDGGARQPAERRAALL